LLAAGEKHLEAAARSAYDSAFDIWKKLRDLKTAVRL